MAVDRSGIHADPIVDAPHHDIPCTSGTLRRVVCTINR
jgi:hypothetical protein